MEFREKIIKLRNEKCWTQAIASEKIGIGENTLKNYESKKISRIPSTDCLKKIAKAYNVSIEYLLDDECNNKTNENIEIGKELSFSDETIAKIKSINQSISNETVGELIRGTSKEKFWKKLDRYITLSKEIEYLFSIIKEALIFKELLYKYSTNKVIQKEEIFEDDFFKNNHCTYIKEDKEELLKQFDNFLKKFSYADSECSDGTILSIFAYKYDDVNWFVQECIKGNAYIPKTLIDEFLMVPEYEIKSRTKEMEFLSFHISKEFNLFLNNYIL